MIWTFPPSSHTDLPKVEGPNSLTIKSFCLPQSNTLDNLELWKYKIRQQTSESEAWIKASIYHIFKRQCHSRQEDCINTKVQRPLKENGKARLLSPFIPRKLIHFKARINGRAIGITIQGQRALFLEGQTCRQTLLGYQMKSATSESKRGHQEGSFPPTTFTVTL